MLDCRHACTRKSFVKGTRAAPLFFEREANKDAHEKGYDELVKRLNLSSHDLNQLKSIKNNLSGPRKYTEMFIKIGKESNIFRLEVPKEVYAAYLTDGKENDRIMRIYEKTNDMEQAIIEFTSKT